MVIKHKKMFHVGNLKEEHNKLASVPLFLYVIMPPQPAAGALKHSLHCIEQNRFLP